MSHTGPASPGGATGPASPGDATGPASPGDIVHLRLAGVSGTGDARVDEAVAWLSRLDDAPLAEHPAIIGQVHDRLRAVLGELAPGDTRHGPGTP